MKKALFILSVIMVLFLIILITQYEYKEVPDINWDEHYGLDSKEPHGLWVFQNVLKDITSPSEVEVDYQFKTRHYDPLKTIYLGLGAELYYDKNESEALFNYVQKGGIVVLLGERIELNGYQDSIGTTDSPYAYSTFTFKMEENSTSSLFKYYDHDFKQSKIIKVHGIKNFVSWDSTIISKSNDILTIDSFVFFKEINIGHGKLLLHSLPQMFTNLASKQQFYNEHFKLFFNRFPKRNWVISKPTIFEEYRKSPLSVILKNQSMATAYYLLLATVFIFLIFNTKRKQRPIPIRAERKNTSLEYVNTLGKLYMLQNRPETLTIKLEENFHHFVVKKYYLQKGEENFVENLSKRSKIKKELIEDILNDFTKIKLENFCDNEQLIALYQKIENFKQQSDDRR